MKHTFHLRAAKEEVFEYFIDVLLQDVLAYTGQTLSRSQLKEGFTYRKNLSSNPKKPRIATVRLTEYHYPEHYAVIYTRDDFRKRAVYDLSDEPQGCRFVMTQQQEKKLRDESGALLWTVTESAEREGKPSLMTRLRMRTVVRQLRKRPKTAVVL